ncbi:MAG: DksA/TraR family C4-type zinc finger protein [Desulfobacteraceae bacterium]|nr:DksA/TraR family C4-type zinc finger protein [Desulfobacteraceae bacterium]
MSIFTCQIKHKQRKQERIMAVGWAKDGAVQEQIDAGVADAVKRARSCLGNGKSRTHCEVCEEPIPEARRHALPGVRLCVQCQTEREKSHAGSSLYNRRGSKDSQLK